MPIVPLPELLNAARRGRYAIPSFNVVTLEMIDGVFRAAEAMRSPVIVGFAARHAEMVNPDLIAGAVAKRAAKSPVPTVFHFDHAESYDAILLGIEMGCNSVMIDGSKLPFEENLELSHRVAMHAHGKNIAVEAELGAIGGIEGEIAGGDSTGSCTEPRQAEEFARRTGVDALAIAIGTVHGLYRRAPLLRFDILKEIARRTRVPLVLHGGTGLSKEDFAQLIDEGISKINVFTELAVRCAEGLRKNLERRPKPAGIAEILRGMPEDLAQVAADFIVQFRCENRVEGHGPAVHSNEVKPSIEEIR